MPPNFPNTEVKHVESWSNYSGTVKNRSIPTYCTPEGGVDESILRLHGNAVRGIARHCFSQTPPLRLSTVGSAWSFSSVVEPGQVVLDPANMNYMRRIPADLLNSTYVNGVGKGKTPVFMEGGTQINSINRRLARDLRLALQTSGSGDGHRIAGAIATGTHGSALQIGALHDTVLGMYLLVGPDRAVFVQSSSAPFATPEIASWLLSKTGIPTELASDDALFNAARVSLGALGIVLAVVVEAVPLYRLKYRSFARPWNDARVWEAINTLNTQPLHPDIAEVPYHFDVVMHPYPKDNAPGLYATLMWKVPADGELPADPLPAVPVASSDLMGLISKAAQGLGAGLFADAAFSLIQDLISSQLGSRGASVEGAESPGRMFGPTTLPPGSGASTEIVVDQRLAQVALNAIYTVLNAQKEAGHFLLGALGIRFVPATSATLGMNIAPMNCYIELPSVRNTNVLRIYRAVWNALEQQNIPFTCHWGQLNGMNASRLTHYFGAERVAAWKRARARLLTSPNGDTTGLKVFDAPILAEVGLE